MVGWAAAEFVHRSINRLRSIPIYAVLAIFALAWSAAWFFFNLSRMPPYIPGATRDPTYAPPRAVVGLLVVAIALVLPGSAIASVLAFRRHRRLLRRMAEQNT
jgi:hypothetical protein